MHWLLLELAPALEPAGVPSIVVAKMQLVEDLMLFVELSNHQHLTAAAAAIGLVVVVSSVAAVVVVSQGELPASAVDLIDCLMHCLSYFDSRSAASFD